MGQNYNDVTMRAMASQITGVSIVYSIVGSGADQIRHQSSASLAFVWGIHRWPVNSPHKGRVTRKMFPFDDVIMGTGPTCRQVHLVHKMLTLRIMFCMIYMIYMYIYIHIYSWVCWKFRLINYFFVFWHMQLYMSWYIRSFFGFTFLNILCFFKYSCTNIFHRRSLYTFYLKAFDGTVSLWYLRNRWRSRFTMMYRTRIGIECTKLWVLLWNIRNICHAFSTL